MLAMASDYHTLAGPEITLSRRCTFSTAIASGPRWHQARVWEYYQTPPDLHAMVEWCDQHCQSRYTHGDHISNHFGRSGYSFWFRNRADHMAFTLTWETR